MTTNCRHIIGIVYARRKMDTLTGMCVILKKKKKKAFALLQKINK